MTLQYIHPNLKMRWTDEDEDDNLMFYILVKWIINKEREKTRNI